MESWYPIKNSVFPSGYQAISAVTNMSLVLQNPDMILRGNIKFEL